MYRAAANVVLLPALVAIAAGLLLALDDGGFAGESWYPVALFVLALLAVSYGVAPPGRAAGIPRAVRGALVALVALALWALLSAMWSDVPAMAWDGANRILLYAIVLALVSSRPWPGGGLMLALAMVSLGLGAIALGILVDGALGRDAARLFIEGRLSAPTGYANATANLWLIGVWPALALACGSRLAWTLRAGSLGVACLLLETSLLSVSRGAVAATAITAIAFVALSSERHRVLAAMAVLTGCTLLAAGPVLAVSDASTVTELDRALGVATTTIAWTCVLAVVLGALGIHVARRAAARMPAEARAAWPRRAMRATAALAAIAAAVLVVGAGNPARWIDDRWQDFKTSGYTKVSTGSQRITGSLGSSRYDFYRVALDEFRGHPLVGIGYGNFQVPYLVDRRTDEAPRYAHSLPLGILAQLGLVGAALLLAFLAAILTAATRALATARERRTLVAGALAGFAVWFVHGLVDWLWEFAALGILAFALLGLGANGAQRQVATLPRRRLRLIAGSLAAVAVATSFAILGLAAHLTRDALDAAARDPAGATALLQRAAGLDRLAAGPLLTSGLLAQRRQDQRAAERAFRRALAREPQNWFAHFELGVLQANSGRRAQALQTLARAKRLNPRQDAIEDVRVAARAGATVDPAEIERRLYGDVNKRLRHLLVP